MSECQVNTKRLLAMMKQAEKQVAVRTRKGYLIGTVDFGGLIANGEYVLAASTKDFLSKGQGSSGADLGITGSLSYADTTLEGSGGSMPKDQSFMIQGMGVRFDPRMPFAAAREIAEHCHLELEIGGQIEKFGPVGLWPAKEFGAKAKIDRAYVFAPDDDAGDANVQWCHTEVQNGDAGIMLFDEDNFIGLPAGHQVKFRIGWSKTLQFAAEDTETALTAGGYGRTQLVLFGTWIQGQFNY